MSSIPLFCFQHCNGINIFCSVTPRCCPVCQMELPLDLVVPPFRIPSPFCNEVNPLSLMIKPTFGNFLSDFNKGDLLHIALSNSKNVIFEFQESGVVCSKTSPSSWMDFISINLAPLIELNFAKLDGTLEKSVNCSSWTKECYDEQNKNCFDYIIYVLNESTYEETLPKWTKERLTEEFISPALNKSMRFLYILREVLDNGVFYPK